MQKVYLLPKNEISVKFASSKYFKDHFILLGFIDNYKEAEDIISLDNKLEKFDLLIISSPNYFNDIYKQLILKNIPKEQIRFHSNKKDGLISDINDIELLNCEPLSDSIFLNSLKNINKNKRIFLLGNGPSLDINDLDLLKNEITFAANKIFLAYENTTWRPTYYMVEDDLVYKQSYSKISELAESIKLFPQYSLNWEERIENAYYFNMKYLPNRKDFPQFNPDPIDGMFWGSTVIYTMIQWAIYLGCKEIYLLGLDFNFTESSKYIINEKDRKDLICEGEVNHFHKDYRKIGEKWNLPNLNIQLESFGKAKKYCRENGVKIYNASRKSKLDVFERINLDELFNKEQ